MKKIFIIISLLLLLMFVGCAGSEYEYEKDTSYETDLYGAYSRPLQHDGDGRNSYVEIYTFNSDNTYHHVENLVSNGEMITDIDETGEIVSYDEISHDLFEINLGDDKVIYKYKNILGGFRKVEVPSGKTFELKLAEGDFWYDKDGQVHICMDGDTCDCSEHCPRYIRKKNKIYWLVEDKNLYMIKLYIVKDGIFYPIMYKE